MSLAQSRPVTFVLTADRKTCEAWYAEKLELKPTHDDGFAAVYDLAGATLRITEIPGFVAGAHPVLGWRVPESCWANDLQAVQSRDMVSRRLRGLSSCSARSPRSTALWLRQPESCHWPPGRPIGWERRWTP
jgi:hypothetical protein